MECPNCKSELNEADNLRASPVNRPALAIHFFTCTTARFVFGVSETISGSVSMRSTFDCSDKDSSS